MSRQIQIRRGTVAQHEMFTGAPGELSFDFNTLRVHDGENPGGIILARADQIADAGIPANADYVVESQLPTAENNYTWYRKYASGWVEQGGRTQFDIITQIPITMVDEYYTITITSASGIGGSGTWSQDRTTTSFRCCGQNYGAQYVSSATHVFWQISGISA